jgi:hypothetical protein
MTLFVGRIKSRGQYITGWGTTKDLQVARIFTRKNDVTRCRPHGCDKEDIEFVEVILAIMPPDASQRLADAIDEEVMAGLDSLMPKPVDLVYNPSSLSD